MQPFPWPFPVLSENCFTTVRGLWSCGRERGRPKRERPGEEMLRSFSSPPTNVQLLLHKHTFPSTSRPLSNLVPCMLQGHHLFGGAVGPGPGMQEHCDLLRQRSVCNIRYAHPPKGHTHIAYLRLTVYPSTLRHLWCSITAQPATPAGPSLVPALACPPARRHVHVLHPQRALRPGP